MSSGFVAICHGLDIGAGKTCQVFARSTGLEAVHEGAVVARLDYRSITVSLAGIDDRYISFEAPFEGRTVTLLVSDRGITAEIAAVGATGRLIEQLRRVGLARARRRAGRTGVIGVLVAVLVGLALLLIFGFGWVADRAVSMIPVEWEKELGRAVASELLKETKICTEPGLVRFSQEIGTRLVGGLRSSPYSFKLRVLDSEEVNAFALPGGYLFVNRGLIEEAEDGAEVAGVLAHEIQHVLKRHGVSNIMRRAGLMLILLALVGDTGGVEQFIIYHGAELASMSFNREQESEADAGGVELMYRASLDPKGLPRFLSKLSEKEGKAGELLNMISTHPASRERVRDLNAIIEANAPPEVTPLRSKLADLSGECAPVALSDPDGSI